jgi:hypothetical protein
MSNVYYFEQRIYDFEQKSIILSQSLLYILNNVYKYLLILNNVYVFILTNVYDFE